MPRKKNKADAEKNSLRFPVIKKNYNFGISSQTFETKHFTQEINIFALC